MASAIGSLVKRERLIAAQIDAERAVAEERARLAREIHDTLAQGFTGVVMQVHATQDALEANDIGDAGLHMQRALDRARVGLSEARRSVYMLRPPLLDDADLADALRIFIARVFDGLPVEASLVVEGHEPAIGDDIATELLRIGQEALNNVLRHAHARRVVVTLSFLNRGHVMLRIDDNGVGFDALSAKVSQGGFGLISMRERAVRIQGELVIESLVSSGTRITVVAPVTSSIRNFRSED
jgi:signal transduction histidine kinase